MGTSPTATAMAPSISWTCEWRGWEVGGGGGGEGGTLMEGKAKGEH